LSCAHNVEAQNIIAKPRCRSFMKTSRGSSITVLRRLPTKSKNNNAGSAYRKDAQHGIGQSCQAKIYRTQWKIVEHCRALWNFLFIAQSGQRIDTGCASRRNVARNEGHCGKQCRNRAEGNRVGRTHIEEHGTHESCQGNRSG
jgi:hypothetical protein